MRHRFSVALYDNYPIDAELIDFIVQHDKSQRQELLRTLLRAGFSTMVKHKDTDDSMFEAMDQDKLALIFKLMSKGAYDTSSVQNKEVNTSNVKEIKKEKNHQNCSISSVSKSVESLPENNNSVIEESLNSNLAIKDELIDNSTQSNEKLELLANYPYNEEDLLETDPSLAEKEVDDDFVDPMERLSKLFT